VTLASMLMTACNTLAATLCYICEGHIDKTVEIWSSLRESYVDVLQVNQYFRDAFRHVYSGYKAYCFSI
jgi:hypothetical protein